MKLIELLLAADALGFSVHKHAFSDETPYWRIWRAPRGASSYIVDNEVYRSEAAAWNKVFQYTANCLPGGRT